MKLMFIPAKYKIDFEIPKNFFETLKKTFKKNSNLAVFSAINFREKLDFVISEIEKEGFTCKISKPSRTQIEGQILGCDSYEDSLNLDLSEIEGFVYLGDGYFHPNALLLAQENQEKLKPVLILNCVQKICEVIETNHIEKYFKKRKANLSKFYMSKNIGVFITTKWGQEYMKTALKLKEKYKDKNFYFFIGDNFLDYEMENFPFCEVWVNTACPRIGQDDVTRHKKPVVNIKDIFN